MGGETPKKKHWQSQCFFFVSVVQKNFYISALFRRSLIVIERTV